jgi:hypothetical protein
MKNVILYWAGAFIPLLLLIYVTRLYHSEYGIYAFLMYAFIYRPILDYWRLRSKNLIYEKDFFKVFNPFFARRYVYQLFFSK